MNDPNFTDHMTDHLANRQRPSGVPEHLLDQADAAAISGARSVDAAAVAGEASGASVARTVGSPHLFGRLSERFTQRFACTHLMKRPGQPRYMHGAALDNVFCLECLVAFFRGPSEALRRYDRSTDCDACGTIVDPGNLRGGNVTNGFETYVVTFCGDCLEPQL